MADHSDNSDIEIVPQPKRKHTSWVWDHFTKTENNSKGECKYCDKVSLLVSVRQLGRTRGQKVYLSTLNPNTQWDHMWLWEWKLIYTQLQDSKKTKQQKIKELIVSRNQVPLPSNSDWAITIQRGILEMIAVHNRPFCIVEDCMLLFVFHLLCMGFVCPGRDFFRTTQLDECALWATQTILEQLLQQPYIHITSDMWTCKYTGVSMLSLSLHWFCIQSWKFRKIVASNICVTGLHVYREHIHCLG